MQGLVKFYVQDRYGFVVCAPDSEMPDKEIFFAGSGIRKDPEMGCSFRLQRGEVVEFLVVPSVKDGRPTAVEIVPTNVELPRHRGVVRRACTVASAGFIKSDGDLDLFFHKEDVNGARPGVGGIVEFDLCQTKRGWRAKEITIASEYFNGSIEDEFLSMEQNDDNA